MKAEVSIVVPFATDHQDGRERPWQWLRDRYARLYPEWEIVTGSAPAGAPWRKGLAVNAAAAVSEGDVLVIADADVLVGADVLPRAVGTLRCGAPWVMPHSMVYRLNLWATVQLLEGSTLITDPTRAVPRPWLERPGHPAPSGGGISLVRRADFFAAGGIDPAFIGWGGEDISFGRALDTLIGTHRSLCAPMWHLHHQPMRRRGGNRASRESERLAARYLDAAGDREAMAEVISR